MKLNLLINTSNVLAGYTNVDPFANEGDTAKVKNDISNLDAIVDDGEAIEIIADSILEYFPLANIDGILDNWIKKLAHGGKLTLVITDIYEVCRLLSRRDMDHQVFNKIVFGQQGQPWEYKKNLLSLAHLEMVLISRGLKIVAKRLIEHRAMIVVERP